MKLRDIKDLHDKEIGHKKFAKVCDLLLEKGYQITEIKEYYEFFKFKLNNIQYWYYKDWKPSAQKFVEETERWYKNVVKIKELQK